jgi:hypothetical protein
MLRQLFAAAAAAAAQGWCLPSFTPLAVPHAASCGAPHANSPQLPASSMLLQAATSPFTCLFTRLLCCRIAQFLMPPSVICLFVFFVDVCRCLQQQGP